MMCQCRFFNADVEKGGGCACGSGGAEGLWEISVLSAQLFCESRIILRRKNLFKKEKDS